MRFLILCALLLGLAAPALAGASDPAAIAENTVRELWAGHAAQVHATFDEAMKAAVTPAGLEEVVAKERQEHGEIVGVADVSVAARGDFHVVKFLLRLRKGRPLRFTVTVRPDGRVAGLFFVPAAGRVAEQDIAAAIARLPGRVSVAALVAEKPSVAFRHRASEPFSVGSQFKVLVLARAAELIARGEWKPAQRLEITPRSRSLPSGILQDFDPGLRPTVNDLLTLMISRSDNTATDTLLLAAGREEVDGRLAAWGFRSRPAMLTTAEMFAVAAGLGGLPDSVRDRHEALSKQDRRALYRTAERSLAALVGDRAAAETRIERYFERVPFAERRALAHLLDWRIPAEELADFYRRVATGRFESPKVSAVVAKYLRKGNAGVIGQHLAADDKVESIARKGGSDAGILTDGGFVTIRDGRHIVIVVCANDLPADASDTVMVPKLGELSQLLFDYLEERSRK